MKSWKGSPKAGENDLLIDWISEANNYNTLIFEETVDPALVQSVVTVGYAPDLTDTELEKIGRDPFLIAYALAQPAERVVVTTEVSKPKALRQNRKIPDVCISLHAQCCNTFAMNKTLGFHTRWRARQT